MTPLDGYEHIDAAGIQKLTRDLVGDLRSCLRFVDAFVDAWAGRMDRVARAVGDGDLDDALAALLSIATSSRMVGAERLGILARELHAQATLSRVVPARDADRLARTGAASCAELRLATASWRLAA